MIKSKRNTVPLTSKMVSTMSYEEDWDAIDDILDRLDRIEDKPVPEPMIAQINALAQRIYDGGRYTAQRSKEMAVSMVYLKERWRPCKGLPCHPHWPSMACLMSECDERIQVRAR